MASIYFSGTYRPILCGIGDYTHFIARELDSSRWKVLSFDLNTCGLQMTQKNEVSKGQAWYGIPGPADFSAPAILSGISALGGRLDDAVVWFQHEHGIWRDDRKFALMLSRLHLPKIVTFHTLHFQSGETPSGLRQNQVEFLGMVLPHVDAITVFSQGVHQAVTGAFPQYWDKVFMLRHGVHVPSNIGGLSRIEARKRLSDFLLHESDLDENTRENLRHTGILSDQDCFIIGQAGFLCPSKQSEFLYQLRDTLQQLVPQKRILALRIGAPRDSSQRTYAQQLRLQTNNRDNFLLESCLPEDMLRVAQKAFDLNFYWPRECSQSGILAHALGVGALVAGREMEGSGETLRMAEAITSKEPQSIIDGIRNLILNPEIGIRMEERALAYAQEFSWKNQAKKHSDLAKKLIATMDKPIIPEKFEKASLRRSAEYAGTGLMSSPS
ncbi:MAG: hypothetical protein PHV74_14600 [Dehalococcoidia bacterium]|nr:hypothetical protein [Dehalococcoidia bacterium]